MNERASERNPLFDLLAGDRNDIEGLTAYALRKRHKRHWAANIRLSGREPSLAEERAFAETAATEDQLDRYRNDAQNILIAFANEFAEDLRPEIERQAIDARITQAAERIDRAGSFVSLVKFGVASTLITSAFVALLAFGAQYFGVDLVDAIAPPSVTD